MSKWLKGLFLFLLCGIASATTCYLSGGSMLMIGGFVVCVQPATAPPCPQTSGGLTLNPTVTRSSGISPLTIWLDNTNNTDASTLAGQNNTFQDVIYSIDFGDTLGSGTRKWAYGSNGTANGGTGNVMNKATGPIAAHTYITEGTDQTYTITTTANDGVNPVVSCSLTVQAFEPSGSNGFTTKVCQSVSGDFTNCPASATHSTNAAVTTNTSSAMNNKMVLFHCGETFTGNMSLGGTKFMVGAYGGCTNASPTAPNSRPIVHGVFMSNVASDGRVVDLDMEGTGSTSAYGYQQSTLDPVTVTTNVTLANLYINNWGQAVYWANVKQNALVNSRMAPTLSTTIQGNFLQYTGNNCANNVSSTLYNCGQGASPVFVDIKYTMAVMGDFFDGASQSQETVRISGCRYCVITNSDFRNAESGKAVLKFHSNDSWTSQPLWIGAWTEYNELSDNFFAGTSGWLVEISPQNSSYDERIRFLIFERNSLNPTSSTTHLEVSANNITARDNVMQTSGEGFGYGTRGTEGGTAGGAPAMTMSTQGEFYNNSCSGLSSCVNFDAGFGGGAAGSNSFAKNNLCFSGTCIGGTTATNTISNNTATTTNNPGFVNGSGTLNVIPDWKPTANYTGGTSVPVQYDALGTAWSPTWDFGAVHH